MSGKLPDHIAIIMDGNGRWARKRLQNRISGHRQGVRVVREVIEHCARRGIGYLTLFTFSSENWKRPALEVKALMGLLGQYLVSEREWLKSLDVRLTYIGDLDRLPDDVRRAAEDARTFTKDCTGMNLTLALSYGGRDELLRAARKMHDHLAATGGSPDDIDEVAFERFLDTSGQPAPDLLIRTSGERRISNFTLWQLAYTELYFTETLWPDFTAGELEQAIQDFQNRERRFGTV